MVMDYEASFFEFYVPLVFWLDHADRCPSDLGENGLAELARVSGRRAFIRANRVQMAELYADAEFYADPDSMDECPRYLRETAKRTVAALKAVQS